MSQYRLIPVARQSVRHTRPRDPGYLGYYAELLQAGRMGLNSRIDGDVCLQPCLDLLQGLSSPLSSDNWKSHEPG
jgi:hypothetical protein